MSVTDDISAQVMNKAEEGIKAVPGMLKGSVVSGIAIVFKAPAFTVHTTMNAVGKASKGFGRLAHNPKYFKNNVSIAELEKNSDIKKIDEGITKDVMKYFDSGCRKYGITYSALADKSNPKEPTYYVFFKGRETPVIEQVLKESYQAFVKEQAKPKVSIRAKLAFFRNRVAARDKEQQDLGKEKHHNRADRQR